MSEEPQQIVTSEPVQTGDSQTAPAVNTFAVPTTPTEAPQVAEESSDTPPQPFVEATTPTQTVSITDSAPRATAPVIEPFQPVEPVSSVNQAMENTPAQEVAAPPQPAIETPQPAQTAATPAQSVMSGASVVALRPQAQAARTNRIQKKLDKIMEFAREKKTIRNDDIEKLLHVSDSTAQRYLGALVKQGKLRKLCNRGSAHYEVI